MKDTNIHPYVISVSWLWMLQKGLAHLSSPIQNEAFIILLHEMLFFPSSHEKYFSAVSIPIMTYPISQK